MAYAYYCYVLFLIFKDSEILIIYQKLIFFPLMIIYIICEKDRNTYVCLPFHMMQIDFLFRK